MSLNLISKYLFLEQKAQSLEEVLTFLTKAGGSIHIFSESTHIEALIKPCKMMKIKKKSYLYNPTQEPLEASPGTIRIIHKMFQGSQPGLKIIVENITKINPNF